MAIKPCVVCLVEPKKPGHNRWCLECWLYRQPADTQKRFKDHRLVLVPAPLHRARVPEREWPPGRRWCAGCQSFPRLIDCTGSRCKACASAAAHGSRLERTYVIGDRPFTAEDYDALLALQGGACYLCGRRSLSRRLAVDHDHATGQVRGLLCPDPEYGCNLKILPRFDADPEPLAMVERLRLYLAGETPAQRLLSRA